MRGCWGDYRIAFNREGILIGSVVWPQVRVYDNDAVINIFDRGHGRITVQVIAQDDNIAEGLARKAREQYFAGKAAVPVGSGGLGRRS